MKRIILMLTVASLIVSCNKESAKTPEGKTLKTAYVDTSKLLEQYTEAKDIEAKYKAKSDEMGKELQAEYNKFRTDAGNFRKDAQAKGQEWAQQKGAELQKREEQLNYAQQAMIRQVQEESGTEMDSMVKKVKGYIKNYGKEKGYDYVFATGEAVSILYAPDKYDITKEVVKLLNEKYASADKKPVSPDLKAEAKKDLQSLESKK